MVPDDFAGFFKSVHRYCECLRLPVDAFELHIPPETLLAGILLTVEQATNDIGHSDRT